MDIIRTEFEFELPKGYITEEGEVHKSGVMRLATAADEIVPMKDPRVRQNPAYLPVILLSRVIIKLGALDQVNTHVIENLYSSDFAFLQDLYQRINQFVEQKIPVQCPNCNTSYEVEVPGLGEE